MDLERGSPGAEPPAGGGPSMVVGLGASAGGVEALGELVAALPASFGGAAIVVLHTSSKGIGALVSVLDRAGPLRVEVATHGEELCGQTIYVAPHDRHLVVKGRTIRLNADPLENGYRPAIDVMLASLRDFDGPAVGVVLSGTLSDGTRGLAALKAAGGIALVQDPAEAQHAGMILSAQRAVAVDATLPAVGLAAHLASLSRFHERRRRGAPATTESDTGSAHGSAAPDPTTRAAAPTDPRA